MSNSEAVFNASVVYPNLAAADPLHSLVLPHALLCRVLHTVVARTSTTVPNTTAAASTVAIGLGSIATEVTGFYLANNTRQDLIVEFAGDTVATTLPSGGFLMRAAPAAASVPITGISVITTATQSGDGFVELLAFGDPS